MCYAVGPLGQSKREVVRLAESCLGVEGANVEGKAPAGLLRRPAFLYWALCALAGLAALAALLLLLAR